MDDFLIPLLISLAGAIFYPLLAIMLILMIAPHLGVWTWAIYLFSLSPFAIVWYKVVKRRMINYQKLILDSSKPREWNTDKTVDEYARLLKKRKRS